MANGIVEPAQTPVAIEPTEPQPKEDAPAPQGGELSDTLLQIPGMQVLMAGAPGAASMKIADIAKTEEGKAIAAEAKQLQSAGFFFYRALSKDVGVIGNGLFVSPEEIQAADKNGALAQIAPDWNLLNSEAARSGELNPALNAQTPAGPPTPPAPAVPQLSSGSLPPPPASTQRQLAGARSRNLQEGSPTSGRAAQGRLLNNLLKPAI